jgi:hypothetical protein
MGGSGKIRRRKLKFGGELRKDWLWGLKTREPDPARFGQCNDSARFRFKRKNHFFSVIFRTKKT